MSGRENLELVARLYGQDRSTARASAQQVLERLGLVEPADRLARTYSGGMRRRLDLGASLVGKPRLLLLDEPTTGLDPRSRIELWDAIRTLVETGTDVLLTTQYLDEADQLAGQIVIIDHGRTIADGTPAELKRQVGGHVIEVHTQRRDQLPTIAETLARLDHGPAKIDEATRRVTVGIDGAGDGLTAAVSALGAAGVEIDDIALRRPTLDEVFLALTGHSATDDRNRSPHAEPAAA
jgi:ABC-2 type transport system ATP-binding protein